ncbi:MAG: hypothetical protein ABIJ81_04245 [Patescibacteria group bacterium]
MSKCLKLFKLANCQTAGDNRKTAGQGLLEATLAIGMILIGLGAILTFTLKNISAAADSGQRITAANLAREAIDVIRGVRDSNWLASGNSDPGRAWDLGLAPDPNQPAIVIFYLPDGTPIEPAKFEIDYIPTSTDVNDNEYKLYRHYQNHEWIQDSTGSSADYNPTGFNRLIKLDPVCDNGSDIEVREGDANCGSDTKVGIRVQATVSWQASGIFGGITRRSLTMQEYLYNWR